MRKDTPDQADHFHAVKFYDTPEALCRIVVDFLGEGFDAGEPGLVIATPRHRDGIISELAARDHDPDRLLSSGALLLVDADETLAHCMVDGLPEPERFNQHVTAAIDRVSRGRKTCTIRAYGEMVDVLWKAGHDVAAIRVEMLWNKLAKSRDFSLLCGYAMGHFYKDASLSAIHHQHSHVVDEMGSLGAARRTRGAA